MKSINDNLDQFDIHMNHCNQGEYEGGCKYGEANNCTALKVDQSGEDEFDAALWIRNNYHLYDNVGAICDALSIQLRNAKAKQALQAQTAQAVVSTTVQAKALTDEQIIRLALANFTERQLRALSYESWKDGIDITVPTVELVKFSRALLASQPSVQPIGWVSESRSDALCDMHYTRGLEQGFMYGERGDYEGFLKTQKSREGYIQTLKATRGECPKQSAQADVAAVRDGWVYTTESLPTVSNNNEKEFTIAVRRRHSGKVYVFAAYYLNEKLLQTCEEDCPEECAPFSGWYIERTSDGDCDTAWEPVLCIGDEVIAWHEHPIFPATPTAQPHGITDYE